MANVSDEEINALLKDVGVPPMSSTTYLHTAKEESLETLLEKIIEATPPPLTEATTFSLESEKPKRFKLALAPIWLSFGVLGAFFLGGALGFYWGNNQKSTPSIPSFAPFEAQLATLIEEVHKLSLLTQPPTPAAEEIIEPLEPYLNGSEDCLSHIR